MEIGRFCRKYIAQNVEEKMIYVEVPIWFLLLCFGAGMVAMGISDWLIGKLFDEPPKIKVKWEKRT